MFCKKTGIFSPKMSTLALFGLFNGENLWNISINRGGGGGTPNTFSYLVKENSINGVGVGYACNGKIF